jgi:hypothetical protein
MSMTRKDFRLFAVEFGRITNPSTRAEATYAFCRVAGYINPRFDAGIFRNAVHDEVQRQREKAKQNEENQE